MSNYPDTLRAISTVNPFGWEICMGFKPYKFCSWGSASLGLCLIHVPANTSFENFFDDYIEQKKVTTEAIEQMRESIIGFATVAKMIWDEKRQLWTCKLEEPALFYEFVPCPGDSGYWSPYENEPRQSVAFQKAWDMIEAGAYTKANPEDLKDIGMNTEDKIKYEAEILSKAGDLAERRDLSYSQKLQLLDEISELTRNPKTLEVLGMMPESFLACEDLSDFMDG